MSAQIAPHTALPRPAWPGAGFDDDDEAPPPKEGEEKKTESTTDVYDKRYLAEKKLIGDWGREPVVDEGYDPSKPLELVRSPPPSRRRRAAAVCVVVRVRVF